MYIIDHGHNQIHCVFVCLFTNKIGDVCLLLVLWLFIFHVRCGRVCKHVVHILVNTDVDPVPVYGKCSDPNTHHNTCAGSR